MILHPRLHECVDLFLPIVQIVGNNKNALDKYYELITTKSLFYFNDMTTSISGKSIMFWMSGGYVSIDNSTAFTPMRICPTIISHISHEMEHVHHSRTSLVKYLDPNKIIPYPCPEEVYFQKNLLSDLFELEQYEGIIHKVRSIIPEGVEASFSLGSDGDKTIFPTVLGIQEAVEKLQGMIDEVT